MNFQIGIFRFYVRDSILYVGNLIMGVLIDHTFYTHRDWFRPEHILLSEHFKNSKYSVEQAPDFIENMFPNVFHAYPF